MERFNIITTAITTVLCSALAGIITYIFTRRKQRADAVKTEAEAVKVEAEADKIETEAEAGRLNNFDKALTMYQSMFDDMAEKYNALNEILSKQRDINRQQQQMYLEMQKKYEEMYQKYLFLEKEYEASKKQELKQAQEIEALHAEIITLQKQLATNL